MNLDTVKPTKAIPRRKRFYAWSAAAFRWVHVYVSMLSFSALMFFAWTGITLNHPTWFRASTPTLRDQIGELDRASLSEPLDKLNLAEELRDRHRLRGKVSRFEASDLDIMIVFKGPGYAADVFIDRESRAYTVSETVHGVASIMNDLHKGRDSGGAWAWFIDVSAVIMMIMSLSGFGLLLYLKKRRAPGLLAAVVGTIAMLLIWALGVP